MSHVVPKHEFITLTPIDLDDANENLRVFTGELEGGLNEHNFANQGFDLGHVDDSVVARPHAASEVSNGAAAPASGVSVTNEFEIPQNGVWSAVTGCTKSFTAVGGALWAIASCQLQSHRFGIQLALRINGAIDPDTIWPFADAEVEFDEPGGTNSTALARQSAGETALLAPALVSTVTAVPPGPCTVELVARTALEARDTSGSATRRKYSVYHREIIAIEV